MAQRPFTIVVWGDSIAAGTAQVKWPALMESSMNVLTNTGRGVKVLNEGTCGMPAAMARNQFNERILPHRPDLVYIQFGFNDIRCDGSRGSLPLSTPEEYYQHLAGMTRACMAEAGTLVLLAGNHRARRIDLMPDGSRYDECRIRYNEVTRRVARDTGVFHVDMAAAIEAAGENWKDAVCEDGVHLAPLGFYLYAQIVAEEIRRIQAKER